MYRTAPKYMRKNFSALRVFKIFVIFSLELSFVFKELLNAEIFIFTEDISVISYI